MNSLSIYIYFFFRFLVHTLIFPSSFHSLLLLLLCIVSHPESSTIYLSVCNVMYCTYSTYNPYEESEEFIYSFIHSFIYSIDWFFSDEYVRLFICLFCCLVGWITILCLTNFINLIVLFSCSWDWKTERSLLVRQVLSTVHRYLCNVRANNDESNGAVDVMWLSWKKKRERVREKDWRYCTYSTTLPLLSPSQPLKWTEVKWRERLHIYTILFYSILFLFHSVLKRKRKRKTKTR